MDDFWNIAYRDNAPALLGVLRRYVREAEIAQDLLHEVFATAIDKYDGYTGKGSFGGWLYRIAVNTALMYLRSEQNRQTVMDVEAVDVEEFIHYDADNADDAHPDNARAVIEAADFSSEELLSAIDRLPNHHKMVFNMYVMDNFSHKQIGVQLNISAGTSKSHLKRARKKVQQFLYDDAMDKKNKKDKRRAASAFLVMFPFLAKGNYIDRLYRDGLSDFTIQPKDSTIQEITNSKIESGGGNAINEVNHGVVEFLTGKLSHVATCCVTAAVTVPVCWLTMSVNSPLNRDGDTVFEQVMVIDTVTQRNAENTLRNAEENLGATPRLLSDSLRNQRQQRNAEIDNLGATPRLLSDSLRNQKPNNTPVENQESEIEPVVVRKQIIEHQTVVVRDTVYIIENE